MEGFPNNLEPIRQFMLEAISEKCEGLMLKLLDSAPAIDTEGAVEAIDGSAESEGETESNNEEEKDELEDEDAVADGAEKPIENGLRKKGRRKALLATYEPDKRVESWVSLRSSVF